MTIKTQAYLQGYLHAKTAAVGLDPNKPIPLNIQQHLSPWTGKETATDTFAEEQKADAIAAGNQWPTLTGDIPPGRRPDGSLNWPWAKQWASPMPLVKNVRDTAVGAAYDVVRGGREVTDWTRENRGNNLKDRPSFVGDVINMVERIKKDPVRNVKQILRDSFYGPGGAWNIATGSSAAAALTKLPRARRAPVAASSKILNMNR